MTLMTILYYIEFLLSIVHSLDHDPGDWDGRGYKPQRLQRLRVALRLGLYARDLKLARGSGGERQPDQALCEPIPADGVRVNYFGLDERDEGAELMSIFSLAASFVPVRVLTRTSR
jgi:hypothetical protein